MNDLSNSSDPQSVSQPVDSPTQGTPTGAKEIEPGSVAPQEGLRDATGQEIELPKEVASSGVRIHPTTVPIPPRVSQMGVKPAGHNVPVQTTTTIAIPMTDDQIAQGLQQGVAFSWRWFSEWCIRRMKQLHVVVKMVHGKLIRVKV